MKSEPDALDQVAELVGGDVTDLPSLLDQLAGHMDLLFKRGHREMTAPDVYAVLNDAQLVVDAWRRYRHYLAQRGK